MVKETNIREALLELVLNNREELAEDLRVAGKLAESDHRQNS